MAGMVLYFPKSKRNITLEKAKEIMASLNENIKKVAVVVSPSIEQVKSIENAGFDFVQIHKDLPDGLFNETLIDVLKAFNVNDLEELGKYKNIGNIKGYVFDAPTYGSGETFDWSLLNNIKRDDKLFILAGGLNGDNVREMCIRDSIRSELDISYGAIPGSIHVSPDNIGNKDVYKRQG